MFVSKLKDSAEKGEAIKGKSPFKRKLFLERQRANVHRESSFSPESILAVWEPEELLDISLLHNLFLLVLKQT